MAFIENNTHTGRKMDAEHLRMYRKNGIQYVPAYVSADEFVQIENESTERGFRTVRL